MLEVSVLTFNAFQENTYLVYNKSGDCVIFDPGCSISVEERQLTSFIEDHKLNPVRLINTHAHIDHVLGNKFVSENYKLDLEIHEEEVDMLRSGPAIAEMYNIPYAVSPEPGRYIAEGDIIKIGSSTLEAILTPGHSPASLSFYCKEQQFLIAGDVLFYGSIGRTDLPGGDYDTLINSIKKKLIPLGDDVKVYPGHGPATTIGFERQNNPFLN